MSTFLVVDVLGTGLRDPLLSPFPQFWLCDGQTFYPALVPDYTMKQIIQITISLGMMLIEILVSMD